MAATLKTTVLQDPSGSTANLTLTTGGAVAVGGAIDINSGAIDGTTIGAASAAAGSFTTVTATDVKATSGQPLNLQEDGGTDVITIEADGDVVINPVSASAGTLTVGTDVRQAVVMDAKIAGTGYQSGSTSAGVGLGVGAMYAGITGEVKMFGGASAPEGWVLCDGSNYDGSSGTAYYNLYQVLGQVYGTGDGTSNDFNVPDMRGRVPVGVGTGTGGGASDTDGGAKPTGGSTLTARERGEWGGTETMTLVTATLPSHNHTITTVSSGSITITDPGHVHAVTSYPPSGSSAAQTVSGNTGPGNLNTLSAYTGISASQGTHTHTIGNTGSATALTSQQKDMPFMALNFIIKL